MPLSVQVLVTHVRRVATQRRVPALVRTVPLTPIQPQEPALVRRVLRVLTQRPELPAVPLVTLPVNTGAAVRV